MNSNIIAVSGKGGVGKTTISAVIVRILTERFPNARILAIDADPAVGLSTALGVQVHHTMDDIRKQIVSKVGEGETNAAIELLSEARFRIVDALVEDRKFAFLAIGRPESAGCFCAVNTYLKEVISLLSQEFDFVVIDGEAGVEQINRRVMDKVTHLLLISDQSKKGTQVVQTIHELAAELVKPDRVGAIINRVTNPELNCLIDLGEIEILSFIDVEDAHIQNDIRGVSVFDLPEDCALIRGVATSLEKMGLLP